MDEHPAAVLQYARPRCGCAPELAQEACVKLAARPSLPDPVLFSLYRGAGPGAVEPRCNCRPGWPGRRRRTLAVAAEQCRFDRRCRLPRLAAVAPAEAAA